MGFASAQQDTGIEEIREFAKGQLKHDLEHRDRQSLFLEENWQACADKGIFGLIAPLEFGGTDKDLLTSVKMLEALGYGCPDNGLTLAVNGQVWAVQEPILRFGNEYQKKKYLTGLINGQYKGAHGMTEAESGSNAFDLKTTAVTVDGGYLLNGKKIYIGLGPVADLILTFASTSPERGSWGISAFLVEASTEGVSLSPSQEKMGLRTAPLGEIEFNNAFVPKENLLGKEGAGASIFNDSMDFERSFIFASHVGSMERQLEQTIEFAKQRVLNDASISKHQAVSHRIADMKIRLESAKHFLYSAARALADGKRAPMEAAMAKLSISEMFVENSMSAIRIHGGKGYLSQYGIERDLRDAIGGVIYSGTSDIQRNLIAGLLGI